MTTDYALLCTAAGLIAGALVGCTLHMHRHADARAARVAAERQLACERRRTAALVREIATLRAERDIAAVQIVALAATTQAATQAVQAAHGLDVAGAAGDVRERFCWN